MSENNENNLILKTSLLLEKNYAGLKITKASLKKINGNELITFECIMDGIKKTINGLYDQFGNKIVSVLDLKSIIIQDDNVLIVDEIENEYYINHHKLVNNTLENIYWGHAFKKDFNEELLKHENIIIMNDREKKYLYNIQKGEIITPFYDNIEYSQEKKDFLVTYAITSNIKLRDDNFNPNVSVYLNNLCGVNGETFYKHFYDINTGKYYRLKNKKDYDRIQVKVNLKAIDNYAKHTKEKSNLKLIKRK